MPRRNRKASRATDVDHVVELVTDAVQDEFADTEPILDNDNLLAQRIQQHNAMTPELSAGDLDAQWDRADVGEETVGGSTPTPDQDIVEELGNAVGITYQDNEPLHTEDKLKERDRDRWELDPASREENA